MKTIITKETTVKTLMDRGGPAKGQKLICPDCGAPSLWNAMSSEDDASVFQQTCKACGKRHYEYIPARHQLGATLDRSAEWDAFRAKYRTAPDEEGGE